MGKGIMEQEEDVGRPEELMVNRYVKLRTATGNIASGLGVLALLWSTVVLLGGFVSVLRVEEFWFLTLLSFLMASKMVEIADNELRKGIYFQEAKVIDILRRQRWIEAHMVATVLRVVLVVKGILFICFALLFYASPCVNLGVSVWRLVRQDYGDAGGDAANRAKLNAALDIFYALILFQSLFAFYFTVFGLKKADMASLTYQHCGLFGKLGLKAVRMYYSETRRKFKKDGELPQNWNLITYGVELLQSASGNDHLWGTRVLDQLVEKGISVREELLSSRVSVQNLISMIGRRRGTDYIEARERSARIVAYLASDLSITHFPGILQCICSLLESWKQFCEPQITCCPLENPDEQRLSDKNDQHESLETSKHQDDAQMSVLIKDEIDYEFEQVVSSSSDGFAWRKIAALHEWNKKQLERVGFSKPKYRYPYGSRGTKELVYQGLVIFERLTQDEENCSEISKHQRLLCKIMSPLSSHDFLSIVWDYRMVEMMTRSLTVVNRLLTSLGDAATSLRQELASNTEAVSNLMVILETDSKGAQKLHEQALEILTELAFDDSFKNIDFNKVFKALLRIFLEKEANNTTVQEHNHGIAQEHNHGTVFHEPKNAISQVEQPDRERATRLRGKAAEALARLLPVHTARGILSEQDRINLSTMVLDQILSSEMGTNQVNRENQSKETKFVAAMLSLTVVMCNQNETSKEYFARPTPKDTDLVKKLKEILEANKCKSAECLRIVKLICQVVIAMIKVEASCIQHFNEHNFTAALTEVLNTMSEVDDCMLFAGNDLEVIKPARSLASLVREAQELLKTATMAG